MTETLRCLRVIGDTILALGALAIAVFVIGLSAGGMTRLERFTVAEPAR